MSSFIDDGGPSRQQRPFAGFGSLFRFMMRRDRVRAPIWVLSIVGLVAASVASIAGLYETPSELREYAALAQADSALKAIAGPGYGLDDPTLGAVVMNEILVYSFVVVALMCSFLVIRHTRAEEEAGRTELIRAACVGRLASLTAACLWVAVLDALVALALALVLIAFGLSWIGACAFGAAVLGVGLVMIGVAAIAAQIASSSRAASAGAGTMLGMFFLIRAVGDLGTGWVTWLSPLGWAQSVRAYADERWWVLVPLGLTAVGLTGGAVFLSARRDLGAGLLGQRPGPDEGARHLASPLSMAARLQRTSLAAWTAGLAILGFFYGIVADEAEQILESEAIAEFFAQAGVGTPTELFLATIVLIIALTASGYTVSTVLRLRTEEMAGRAEPILACPVSRSRWLMSYFVVAAVGTTIAMTVSGLAIGLGASAQVGDGAQILSVLIACLAMVPAMLVLAGFAVGLVGLSPRWSLLAWTGLAVSAIVGLLADTLDLPTWLRNASPFEHVPAMPAADFQLTPLLVLLAIAAALTLSGIAAMARRDVA